MSTILANATLKIFCSTDDIIGREFLTQTSGETRRVLEAVGYTSTDTPNGTTEGTTHQRREEAVPRLDDEAINRANRDPLSFIAIASLGKGYTQYRFPVTVRTVFHVSEQEYLRRKAKAWPAGNQFTVTCDAVARVGEPDPPPQAAPEDPPTTAETAPPQATTDAVQAGPAEAVAPEAPQGPPPQPRRRGRPPRRERQQAEEPRVPAAIAGEAGEMAEYLRRLAVDVKAEDQVIVEEDT